MAKANKLLIAYKVLVSVIEQKRHLTEALSLLPNELENKAFVAELCFGVCRYYHHLLWLQSTILEKPLKGKDEREVRLCLCLGMYQLLWMNVPAAVVVNNSVELIKDLQKSSAKGLINACLRKTLTRLESEDCRPSNKTHYSHPKWFSKLVTKAWGERSARILEANNQRAPMVLRVNQQKITQAEYVSLLEQEGISIAALGQTNEAIILSKNTPVSKLPKFQEGFVSVQSESAQWAAHLLDLEPNLRVLDACSAPGMKTTHLLECEPSLQVSALELNKARALKIKENLARLEFQAELILGDAATPNGWWDGRQFDRILCDVPCTATGVIRKHPDIKVLRTKDELELVVKTQAEILNALWPLLKKGGMLLYATCSILPAENELQLRQFLENNKDAKVLSLPSELGEWQGSGAQRFPYQSEGFYYAKLMKV
jgi:16S rRNA (cytosine967-C5)-methyltransferase